MALKHFKICYLMLPKRKQIALIYRSLNKTNDSPWAQHSGKVLIKNVGRCPSPPPVDTHWSETS